MDLVVLTEVLADGTYVVQVHVPAESLDVEVPALDLLSALSEPAALDLLDFVFLEQLDLLDGLHD